MYSRFLDPADRGTVAVFGDGAAATVLGPVPAPYGIGPVTLGSDGSGTEDVLIPAGGSRAPASAATLAGGGHTIRMDGRAVRGFIASVFPRLVAEATEGAAADLALVVPHQPNPRLVASLAPGDLVLLAGFGAGVTWGHTVLTWPPG